MKNHILLICTVGGTKDPIVYSIKSSKPDSVIFVQSKSTNGSYGSDVTTKEIIEETFLTAKYKYRTLDIDNPQDFERCVSNMKGLEKDIQTWQKTSEHHQVIIDITGGTKCMSAAISLVARNCQCLFSYVGGDKRDKAGKGVVESGSEQSFHTQNPWNALGYQAIDEACLLFDKNSFVPAAELLERMQKATDDIDTKQQLMAVFHLCQGYGHWDLFQHQQAKEHLELALEDKNALIKALGVDRESRIYQIVNKHINILNHFMNSTPTLNHISDLIANAKRRIEIGRFDDACARLNRAIEAIAQLAIQKKFKNTNLQKLKIQDVPKHLTHLLNIKKQISLSLKNAYDILIKTGDNLGLTYKRLGLDKYDSIVTKRNQTILAHGFNPITKSDCIKLYEISLKLCELNEADLLVFPKISN